MSRRADEALLETAASAFREFGSDGRTRTSPAWADLAPEAREALFEVQSALRELERARDPRGLSGTVRAVLARLR